MKIYQVVGTQAGLPPLVFMRRFRKKGRALDLLARCMRSHIAGELVEINRRTGELEKVGSFERV